jgi:hypothetical protein
MIVAVAVRVVMRMTLAVLVIVIIMFVTRMIVVVLLLASVFVFAFVRHILVSCFFNFSYCCLLPIAYCLFLLLRHSFQDLPLLVSYFHNRQS